MKYFAGLFFAMFAYGLLFGHAGAGLLAFAIGVFMLYADWVFKQQDKRWREDPRNATTEPCTTHELDEQCCECSGDRL